MEKDLVSVENDECMWGAKFLDVNGSYILYFIEQLSYIFFNIVLATLTFGIYSTNELFELFP